MRKHLILIVDDEANVLATLSRVLRGEDREILLAENARQALEKLKNSAGADLVISDNRLPDTSGIDLLVKIRQLYPDTIRILITGYPDLESAMNAINKGQAYRFITKPWENEELKLIVKQALSYGDVLKDNRILLKIAKRQAEMLQSLQEKFPGIRPPDIEQMGVYIIEENKVSETLEEFLKKYYPGDSKI